MKKKLITVRDVDENTFRKFRAITIEEKMKLGDAITMAMRHWIDDEKVRSVKQKNSTLRLVKPFDWGKGTEKTSKEIDEIIYGSKR